MSNIVQSLWIGENLSIMEILSINSFLKNNYEYHLYTYGDIQNIPTGVIIKDANDILDKSEVYTYKNKSYSAISNHFRFALLYEKGGMWCDTDVICTKSYNEAKEELDQKYIIISESNKKYNEEKIGCSILKFPKNDPILLDAIEECESKKQSILDGTFTWGLGPTTTKYLVEKYKLQQYVKPWSFANSCSCHHVMTIIDPNYKSSSNSENGYYNDINKLPKKNCFIHLFNEFWRKNDIDKNKKYNINSLYEQLKIKYL